MPNVLRIIQCADLDLDTLHDTLLSLDGFDDHSNLFNLNSLRRDGIFEWHTPNQLSTVYRVVISLVCVASNSFVDIVCDLNIDLAIGSVFFALIWFTESVEYKFNTVIPVCCLDDSRSSIIWILGIGEET